MLHKDISKRLGKRFREMRLARGWSQEDMQERGFSFRYYGKIERGTVNPTIETIARLAAVFDTTLADLFRSAFPEDALSDEAEEVLARVNRIIQEGDKDALRKLNVFLKEIV